ncbi:MAG: glycosyltransferase family 2 protein [Prevotellaceae bacterium]|jgi:glycosyltransferase involved in cell wall biosynthesis|nr:glycosyltransferase family 2 protein [Prevotellaceae bacterium]
MNNPVQTLSIIIPAYNEEKTILALLQKVSEVHLVNNMQKEVVVVNDCSHDATEQLVLSYKAQHPELPLIYCKLPENKGKGAAVRLGIAQTSGNCIIIQDADLECDPQDYNALLEVFLQKNLKALYGSRFLKPKNKHSYLYFYLGGRLVTLVANVLYRQRLTDASTCYKLFEASFLKSIPLKCTGFEFCPEVTAKVAKRGIKIEEVPISYYPRSIEDGKKIKWIDGLYAIWTLLKYRFVK